jgi:transposase InsO family protein
VLVELSVMEQRYQAVMEVIQAHVPVTEVAERYGVSRQAVHRWIRHYRSGGITALSDQPRTPRSSPLRLSPEVEAAICEMREKHRRWGPRTLAYWLANEGIDPAPARSTIYRVLVRNHLIVPVSRKRKRESYVRWERGAPMELWQHDFISGVMLKNGRELKVVTGIDDHSRYCVLAKVITRASGRQVCLAFAQALATYGIPDEVLSDNGVQFTSRLISRKTMGEALFERICRENHIVQRFTKVASPTTTGKIERLHLTMREMLDEHGPFADADEVQEAFDLWRADYNDLRPHQSLDMATPASRFVPRPETIGDLVLPAELRIVPGERVIEPDEEAEHFVAEPNSAVVDVEAVEFTRTVPACGNLSISEQQIWIGPKWAGREVHFWADTVSVHVTMGGQHLKTVPSRLSTNSLHRLIAEGAVPAGPPPRSPAAIGLRAADATLELERTVNAAGLVSLADTQFSVGFQFAGERVRIVLEHDLAHIVRDGVVVRSFPCALPPAKRQRLQGARVAQSLDLRTEPLVVARRVSAQGAIQIGGQKVIVGTSHRRKIVEVLVEHRYLRIMENGTTLKTVARNSTKEVKRFKASGKAANFS